MLCVTKIYHCTLPEVSFCRPVYLQPRYDVLATKESLLRLWYGLGARRLLYGAVHLGRARRPVHHSGVALPATYLGSGFGCGSCGRTLQFPKLHLRPSRPSGARAHAFALQHCLLPRLSMLILALSVDTYLRRKKGHAGNFFPRFLLRASIDWTNTAAGCGLPNESPKGLALSSVQALEYLKNVLTR